MTQPPGPQFPVEMVTCDNMSAGGERERWGVIDSSSESVWGEDLPPMSQQSYVRDQPRGRCRIIESIVGARVGSSKKHWIALSDIARIVTRDFSSLRHTAIVKDRKLVTREENGRNDRSREENDGRRTEENGEENDRSREKNNMRGEWEENDGEKN
ncbi:hypothetical protein BDP27DRAFT_1368406 [Rhodocollybia butyracea]|uniref:Uncharacterized protein n=1 Tax=Rhodocollybia butyracea TaxID=206335 RepID=A0A9P5PHX4_9AGAR|nr:hypothetical protein BDP27DRAFT_1368406 [Rhodocollybia butyracea]